MARVGHSAGAGSPLGVTMVRPNNWAAGLDDYASARKRKTSRAEISCAFLLGLNTQKVIRLPAFSMRLNTLENMAPSRIFKCILRFSDDMEVSCGPDMRRLTRSVRVPRWIRRG